ncbi:hypothetical protein K438DRAFT_1569801 [Mycena galopus ATCC 62051]|nr:hypothetical protein K438DRAFT_1569801 [Mycena galopus ATCC 62051]
MINFKPAVIFQPHSPGGSPPSNVRPPLPRQRIKPVVILQPPSPGGSPPSNARSPLPRQRIKPVVILQPPSPGGSPPSNARSPLPRQRIKPVVILQPPSPGGSPPSNARSPLPRQRIYLGRKTPYAGLSTRSPHPVTYNGKQYPTAEHLFQAFKFMDNRPDIAEYIRTVSTEKACQYGESYKTHRHPDWDKMKTYQMEITLWHKFSQNAELKKILLGTGDAELVHFATGPFWGVGKDYNGRNEYGKALERVRNGLRET